MSSSRRTSSQKKYTDKFIAKAKKQIQAQLKKPALKHRKTEHDWRTVKNYGKAIYDVITGNQQDDIYFKKEFYQIVDRTKYWSMAGYILLAVFSLINTIVTFIWYNNELKQKNKKKQNKYLSQAIVSLILTFALFVYIIYLESLWGLFR